ncbi:hypothetical protein DSOL_5347 [Desulfosporosinus metallidurans]|uniref:Uncharacterized protein n=1 Tax=Desulfosporosinus metallidurans TaxID=1888891 RepID=A0A1Q8QDC2_9FIRM|nr:hypothetical protein DSOL_5347 [Desulfosporosinus metallidurans]
MGIHGMPNSLLGVPGDIWYPRFMIWVFRPHVSTHMGFFGMRKMK